MSSDGSDLRHRYDREFDFACASFIVDDLGIRSRDTVDRLLARITKVRDAELESWRWRAEKARVEADELRELVKELTDSGPCQYDHEDQCQGHSLHYRPCPHGRAQALFKEQEGE